MSNTIKLALLAGFVCLSGCQKSQLPPPVVLTAGMSDVLTDTGLYAEAGVAQVLGHHYKPSEDTWTVLACYQFVTVNGVQGQNCVDSFKTYQIDKDNWVVAVTVEGIYRWRAISISANSQSSSPPQDAAIQDR